MNVKGIYFIILISFVMGGCTPFLKESKRVNYSPLFHYRGDKETKNLDVLGPLFSYHSSPEVDEWAFRPLCSYVHDKASGIKEYQFLYPFGRFKSSKERKENKFIPIFRNTRSSFSQKRHFELFPIYWGKTDAGETYGGLFPVYGTFKKRFGRNKINFILWPLYSSSQKEKNSYYNFLWPIFSYIKGDDERGWRMWPLFGYEEKEGDYSDHYILWPFFIRRKSSLNTGEPEDFFSLIPFYVSYDAPQKRERYYLFPLFHTYHNKALEYEQIDYPWPFLQWAEGKEYVSRKYFPVYTYKKKKNKYDSSVLWPLYEYEKEWDKRLVITKYRSLIINKWETKIFSDKSTKEIARLWPLFYYEKGRQEDELFFLLELFPIKDEGFERNYGPLVKFFEHRKGIEGNTSTTFLWGTFSAEKMHERKIIEIPLIFSYETCPDYKNFSLIKGLFEYRRDGSERALRLFYSPWDIRWGKRLENQLKTVKENIWVK
ncbi:MAG: hypothetical protein SVW57_01945 [Thermodesulfobacteriota bacterium]|nr:hypothetical protein [Thermodesulfobacteriota bacterium]